MNKKKIFNDPVYGFISISHEIIFDLIEHTYFQRLRNIKQLGLTHLVYPGALHTRFHHALGAMHLMSIALETLRSKSVKITDEECEAVTIAVLLHDIGHGPFSHALEGCIIPELNHEDISLYFMNELNREMNGKLDMAISIFRDTYSKKFLHQLVSGQLDMDRLDYLNRDSFFTGVSEGVIGFDRILKMLNVKNDQLVVEDKAIYSIEKFLISRRLMYWQVYLHKTVIAAEQMLLHTILRAKELASKGRDLFATPSFSLFLKENISREKFMNDKKYLDAFAALDDTDIFSAIKVWAHGDDKILARLCEGLINRNLYKIEIQPEKFPEQLIETLKEKASGLFNVQREEAEYFVLNGRIFNNAYSLETGSINILDKTSSLKDIAEASDNPTLSLLSKPVEKYFMCYPQELR